MGSHTRDSDIKARVLADQLMRINAASYAEGRFEVAYHVLGAALHCASGKLDAMALRPTQCEEGVAAAHAARIERQPGQHDAANAGHRSYLRIGDPQQQLIEVAGTHGVASSTGASSMFGAVGGLLPVRPSGDCRGPPTYQRPMLSGGMSSRRSAPAMTLAKTGAETRPP